MPAQKGRKRRRDRERSRGPAREDGYDETASAPRTEAPRVMQTGIDAALPSRNVRLAGFALALVTLMLGGLLLKSAFDSAGIDSIVRIVGAALMLLLALAVAVLSLMPAAVRSFFAREE